VLKNEAACSSIVVMTMTVPSDSRVRNSGSLAVYIIVGSSFSDRVGASSLNVYKWNAESERFEFHHAPLAVSQNTAQHVSKMDGIAIIGPDGEAEHHLLAVAHFWDGDATSVYSMLLRFDASEDRFKVLASVMGSGATDVALVSLPASNRTLMLLSSFLNGTCNASEMPTGFVAVYDLALHAGQADLRLIQCIASRGVTDLESFDIDGEVLIAVAQRQVSATTRGASSTFTCVTSTKVQILTPEALRGRSKLACPSEPLRRPRIRRTRQSTDGARNTRGMSSSSRLMRNRSTPFPTRRPPSSNSNAFAPLAAFPASRTNACPATCAQA